MARSRSRKGKGKQVCSGAASGRIRSSSRSSVIVFASTAWIPKIGAARKIREHYLDYILGLGDYSEFAETRLRQGIPSTWQKSLKHRVFDGDHDLDNGEAFRLSVRHLPKSDGGILLRFARILSMDDPGALDPIVNSFEAVHSGRQANPFPKLFTEGIGLPPGTLPAVQIEYISMFPQGKATVVRHMVELIMPPPVIAAGLVPTFHVPVPWSFAVRHQSTDTPDYPGTAWAVAPGDDLDHVRSFFDRRPNCIFALRAHADRLGSLEEADEYLDPLLDEVGEFARFFILTPDLSDEAVEAMAGIPGAPFKKGTLRFYPDGLMVESGSPQFVDFPCGDYRALDCEAILGRIAPFFQNLRDRYDLVSDVDASESEREAKGGGGIQLDELVKSQASDLQRLQRELGQANGRAQQFEARVRQLENASLAAAKHHEARMAEAEGRCKALAAEADHLRTTLNGAASQMTLLEKMVEAGKAENLEALIASNEAFAQEFEVSRRLVDAAQAETAAMTQELQGLRQRLHASECRADALSGARVASNGDDKAAKRDLVMAALSGEPSLEQGLQFIQEHFGDRITVLASAMASARESDEAGFLYRGRAFAMLKSLVTTYWESLVAGGGDARARDIFGKDGYSSKESDTGEGNERMRRERTFTYKGSPVYMGRHLKIGYKESREETVRIHFHWDAEEKRIVIGHCGKHLFKLG